MCVCIFTKRYYIQITPSILELEITKTRKYIQHSLLRRKPVIIIHSVQTTISFNHHKVLVLSLTNIKLVSYECANLQKNAIVRLIHL